MENENVTRLADYLIERLKNLEYAIRQSIAVREDQEEAALPQHVSEAEHCGIHIGKDATKGDLLEAVQTLGRATKGKRNTLRSVE